MTDPAKKDAQAPDSRRGLALALFLVLLVMALIFCFSAQTGEESGETSGAAVRLLLRLLFPDYEGLDRARQTLLYDRVSFFLRKAGHFTEFALLGVTLWNLLTRLRQGRQIPLPALWAWGIGTLYAASDELHQRFVPGRGPSVRDVGLDSLGVAAGILLLWLLQRAATRRNAAAAGR